MWSKIMNTEGYNPKKDYTPGFWDGVTINSTISAKFQDRQEHGHDITKDDILNLRIDLETKTSAEFVAVI
jgi:hypothetical protein